MCLQRWRARWGSSSRVPRIAFTSTSVPLHGVVNLVANGKTQAAVQAILDAIAGQGRVAYLPWDRYEGWANVLVVSEDTRLVGDGEGLTVIEGPAGAYPTRYVNGTLVVGTIAVVGASRVTVEGITIDHATNGTLGSAVEFVPDANFTGDFCEDCVVRNVEVLGVYRTFALLWSMRGQRMKFLDCHVDGGWTDGMPGGYDQQGIEIYGGDTVEIRGCIINRIGGEGISMGTGAGLDDTALTGVICTVNQLKGCRNGISAGATDGATEAQDAKDFSIHHNIIRDTVGFGIWIVTQADARLINFNVDWNIVDGAEVGLEVFGVFGVEHIGVVIANNNLRLCRTTQRGALGCFYTNATIRENTISDSAGVAMYLQAADDLNIIGNNIYNCVLQAILGDSCNALKIANNNLLGYSSGGAQSGIVLSTCVVVDIVENKLRTSSPGTTHEIIVDGQCDRVREFGNRNPTGAPVYFLLLGTNPNYSPVATPTTVAAAAAFKDVANTQCTQMSRPIVNQLTGTPLKCNVIPGTGTFRIDWGSAAVGNETFAWRL